MHECCKSCGEKALIAYDFCEPDHPHGKKLRAAAVGMAQRQLRARHLVRTGVAAHLARRLGKTDHAGRADGVGRQYAAGTVPGNIAAFIQRGGACHGQLPALPYRREAEVLQPHRLVPAERHVHLCAVQVLARIGDAGLLVHIRRAVATGLRIDLITAGENGRLRTHRAAANPGRWFR